MQDVWVEIQCSKCGTMDQKRYILESLNCFNEFLMKCSSCNCENLEMMKIRDMVIEKAEPIVLFE